MITTDLQKRRMELVDRIEVALTFIKDSIECNDHTEIIDWSTTVAGMANKLIVTAVTNIHNRPHIGD